jgi:heat-inducible transcriptional repressor
METQFSRRERDILLAIIGSHIATGEPVGSRFLSTQLGSALSPATIRNIMADLEEGGYLRQPHVSAGRVPTDKAYRFFVDSLIQTKSGGQVLPSLEWNCGSLRGEPELAARTASRTLSEVTRYVGLVMAPRIINTVLERIEFVPLRPRTILAILVSREGLIHNRLLETSREYSPADLETMASFLNDRYAGQHLREIREAIVREMEEEKNRYEALLQHAISLGRTMVTMEGGEGGLIVEGAANMFSLPEFADIDKMRNLFRTFEEKSHLAELMDRCIEAQGVRIFIGAENPYHELRDLSLVTAPYGTREKVLGVIGVLGPTRMAYDRVIPLVGYSADYLSNLMERGRNDEGTGHGTG